MVRLKDIAAQAGVSLMTASKAMRDASDVSAQTRARIRLLAQQMGYVPNSMAQGLRSRTTHLLGLVLSSAGNPILSSAISAIEEGAHDWGYDVVLCHTLNKPEREDACIRRLLARRVDGMLICPVDRLAPTAATYDDLWQRQIPTVILGRRSPYCVRFHNVECDDQGGSYQMTRHLIELGHKRIAFLSGPPGAPWAQERLEGYRRGLREQVIEPDDRLVFAAGASMEEGEKAALQMLHESASMTAIQAAHDLVAIGAANVFLNQGISIPNDLSIGGFGNILMSEHYRVPLSTVREPKFVLGTAAMDLMQKLLLGERPGSVHLPAALIVRASTGAPKV
jgi:DNA-binding LacI/PurR family transcriptional regulator